MIDNTNNMYIFTPVNPYPCPTCSRTYKSKKSVYKHKKYQCGMEPQFKCNFCLHRTYFKANMKKHCKLKHKSENIDFDNF